jgi:hypothetical protein
MTAPALTDDLTGLTRLEMLRLPAIDQPLLRCGHQCAHGFGPRWWRHANRLAALMPPRDRRARGWYRWMLGHHVAFGTWRVLADLLQATIDGRGERSRLLDQAASLYEVYSALLLYSGSCSSEIYAEVIRPRMAATDPAFSGTWARDHERLQRLMRMVAVDPAGALKKASKFNKLVHMTVAKRLVPAGHSLLRDAGRAGDVVTDADRDTLDRFFLVDRARVCQAEFVEQLLQRIARIRCDLGVHPLDARYDRGDVARAQVAVADRITQFSEALAVLVRCATPGRREGRCMPVKPGGRKEIRVRR